MTKKSKEIAIPIEINLLAEAMQVNDPQAARLLVEKAIAASLDNSNGFFSLNELNQHDVDGLLALIQNIQPKDAI
jgi:hypothetical protein